MNSISVSCIETKFYSLVFEFKVTYLYISLE